MSRYYRIAIAPPNSNGTSSTSNSTNSDIFGVIARSLTGPKSINNVFPMDSSGNPNSLKIEMDISLTSNGTLGSGNKILTIWGVDPTILGQAYNLNGYIVTMNAGFLPGLPLATAMAPKCKNPIFVGQVWQPWGNWVGTEIYLCLPIVPHVGQPSDKGNIVWAGKAGQSYQSTITQCINTAFPKLVCTVDVSPNLAIQQGQEQSVYTSLSDFSSFLEDSSYSQLKYSVPNYQGIKTCWKGNSLLISDKVTPQGSKTVNILDYELLGNPVWVGAETLQVACPMRSDIQLMDIITLPNTPQTYANPQAAMFSRTKWTGNYSVINIRYVGNSRSSDALTWTAIYTCYAQPVSPSNQGSSIGSTNSAQAFPVDLAL